MDNPIYRRLDSGYFIGPVVVGDRQAFVDHLNDRRIYECTLNIPFPYTYADADWWLDRRVLHSTQSRETLFAIRNTDSYLVGTIDAGGAFAIGEDHSSEIGYWLATPYWGRGIMTEAISWLCEHAYRELSLRRLTAHIFATNLRSARVLEKNGFQFQSDVPNYCFKDSRPVDAKLYALVR